MTEAYCAKINPEGGPASCFRDKHQIDGVQNTRSMVPTSVSIYTFHFRVDNHRAHVADCKLNGILGELSEMLRSLDRRRLI